jgi:hypothetical protein
MPFNYDQWDGYPAARQRLFESVRRAAVDNWVVLTGDIHSSWAFELYEDPFADDPGEPLGVELVTPAVTSPGITHYTQAQVASSSLSGLLPHLNCVDFYYRGYVLLDITRERLQAEWWTISKPIVTAANACGHWWLRRAASACVQPAPSPQHAQPLLWHLLLPTTSRSCANGAVLTPACSMACWPAAWWSRVTEKALSRCARTTQPTTHHTVCGYQ